MKSNESIRLNIGGVSIIVILLVLSLTIFAMLSIRTSYHELKLAEKTKANIEEYYQADSRAEEILMQLSDLLYQLQWDNSEDQWNQLESEALTISEVTEVNLQDKLITYEVAMNDASMLKIELAPDINNSEPYFKIISWKMVTKEQGDYDPNSIEIWDGTIDE